MKVHQAIKQYNKVQDSVEKFGYAINYCLGLISKVASISKTHPNTIRMIIKATDADWRKFANTVKPYHIENGIEHYLSEKLFREIFAQKVPSESTKRMFILFGWDFEGAIDPASTKSKGDYIQRVII